MKAHAHFPKLVAYSATPPRDFQRIVADRSSKVEHRSMFVCNVYPKIRQCQITSLCQRRYLHTKLLPPFTMYEHTSLYGTPIYANNTIAGVARWRFGDTSKGTYGEPCVRGNCCALARRPWKLCKVTRVPTTTTKKRHSPRLYLFAIEINGLRRWPKCASACDTRT